MKDLDKRIAKWNTGSPQQYKSVSLPMPFHPYLDYFLDKRVLEIGPGGGRQFMTLCHWTDRYSVADISPVVLGQIFYKDCEHKLQIHSFEDNFGIQFQVIHFWYVLHHIMKEEVIPFVQFIERHLEQGGHVLFNTPNLNEGGYANDGLNTTPHELIEVIESFSQHFHPLIIDGRRYVRSNGFVFVGRKR